MRQSDTLLFTLAALLDLLSQIEELKDVEVGVDENPEGILVTVGSSTYIVQDSAASEVEVDSTVVADVADINFQAFEDLSSTGQFDEIQDVTGGVIGSIAKTLLVGGLVRLTNKILNK